MKGFDPATSFGENVAATYDDVLRGDEDDTVAFLEGLAGEGAALELAIGTGRIGLPLAARAVQVDGIEISQPMVDRLRAKPGGNEISVTIGDFADVAVSGSFRLIFVVFNTFFNLLHQNDQVRCFENVAAHLDDDGAFVIEAFVPSFLYRLRDDQYVDAETIEVDEVRLDVGRHDPVAQLLDESHVSLTNAGVRVTPIVARYAWPSELDLMARIAGLQLQERWAGWNNEPFTSASERHVSVYGKSRL
ncbi:MAG: class I SAM-dependent methyltransferase [Actinobacteria bacterium]|nr:class I SAM-dependent methyltransferase [Actinomycetota bacterium]